ncbi:hypothetical protein Ade02nite_10740 [Paractinoplanes deccanensis]|uniref:Nucleoside-diphosphate kinase n=1 Tax=Paractinoplanes deccanensis TaxID=113561 RepID=A0ABQ3XXF4_9ACTN|nr:nucleoside-diphosphate kinase [Actinoplanes deccanensis]GID72433.1 hypothetical protein Ade02nite_10740 [Actinoplanes deccanensis]
MTVSHILDGLACIDRGKLDFAVVAELSAPESPGTAEKQKQALVFLKPELLYSEPSRSAALRVVVDVLERDGLSIHGAAVLGPRRLARVIPRHYGVINYVSQRGAEALSATASAALDRAFGDDMRAGVPVLGGHQLLSSTSVSARRLAELIDGRAPVKLAPGTYATKATTDEGAVIVLNGFHPEQLEHYTQPEARVVALEVRWAEPAWSAFRADVVGATDPAKASESSIRGLLHGEREALSIGAVTISRNGVHGSAGPLEAMIELSRFFGVPAADTDFGSRLATSGRAATRDLVVYESLDRAIVQQLFDATEDVEPDDAVEILGDLHADR